MAPGSRLAGSFLSDGGPTIGGRTCRSIASILRICWSCSCRLSPSATQPGPVPQLSLPTTSQRGASARDPPNGGIPERGMPWVIHQKRSPAVCCAVWGARRSAGRRGKRAPPGPSPAPVVPWQTVQFVS